MQIAVTGAAGEIGSEIVNKLSGEGHNIIRITHPKHDISDSYSIDLRNGGDLLEALQGVETVIHLAADRSATASWDSVLDNNIVGTFKLYSAVEKSDVRRVIFASSNHVQHMRNIGDPNDPATMTEHPEICRPDSNMWPDSLYGVSKIFGEAVGSFYADRFGIEVINFRIGWFLTEEQLKTKQSKKEAIARYARAMWLSPRDCRQAMQLAVETDMSENPITVNLISNNSDRYLSIIETMHALGYDPLDNSGQICEAH